MLDYVATIGNPNEVNCWSGIPYHFLQATQATGWQTKALELRMESFKWSRRMWNLRRLLRGRKAGGYQYSDVFNKRALNGVPPGVLSGRILSFNQHFPRSDSIAGAGGRLCLYLDATVPQLLDRYKLGAALAPDVQRYMLEVERESFARAEHLVFFQHWAAQSAVTDCGASPGKVHVILPGANVHFESGINRVSTEGVPGGDRPLVLGFVGKDWRRKGVVTLLEIKRRLLARRFRVVVRCAGFSPSEIPPESGLETVGFIDKRNDLAGFQEFVSSCDFGCLFSTAEASSIAVLEFLAVGVPVMGFVVDGMGDLFPERASLRFSPDESIDDIVDRIGDILANPERLIAMRESAQRMSSLVTWDRCVREWAELLGSGKVMTPVRLQNTL